MTSLTLFFTVLFTVFIAEMGDKTQLMLIAMTSKYKIRHICIGTALAILVLNGLAVIAGGLLNEFLKANLWIVKIVAAAAFLYFSITSLKKEDDEEEEAGSSKFNFAPVAVFCTFFVAELGDKTQLTAITFGATNGLNASAIYIWVASSIGLFAADIIGMLIGYLLHGKTPDGFFNILAFVIFAVFGFINLPDGLYKLFSETPSENAGYLEMLKFPMVLPVTLVVLVVFCALCVLMIIFNKKLEKSVK